MCMLKLDFIKDIFKKADWKKAARNKKVWVAAFALVVAILEAAGVPVGEGLQVYFEKFIQLMVMVGFFS